MNKYGYVRVSSANQNTDRQLADFKKLNIDSKNIFTDKQSGKDFNRPEYQKMISILKNGRKARYL